MRDQMYAKASRNHRRKAFVFAFAFHAILLSLLIVNTQTDIDWQEYLPETVKEWLNDAPEAKEEGQVAA